MFKKIVLWGVIVLVVIVVGLILSQSKTVEDELVVPDSTIANQVEDLWQAMDATLPEQASYALDLDNSSLAWSATRLAGSPHIGTVNIIAGNLTREGGEFTGGEFVLDMNSITESKNNERFLGHVRSDDFFDVEQFPEARFVITGLAPADIAGPNKYSITGDLTIRDQTHSVNFFATTEVGEGEIGVQAVFDIDRTRWDIIFDSVNFFQELGDRAIKDEIELELDLVFEIQSDGNIVLEIATEEVAYFDGVSGYLAKPAAEGVYPGLILIHEWWGLNEDIKSIAQRFAQAGYVALAVDMYEGQVTTESAKARVLSTAVRDDVEGAFENLGAALDYLRARPEVTDEKLASVGWCFGGGWAYQMALNDLDIEASVMYYGRFNPDDDFDMMRADILGHFGEADASIAVDSVSEFQAALNTTNGKHEVFIYPNVGHGFANEREGDNPAYSAEEAGIAWQRTIDFLTRQFN